MINKIDREELRGIVAETLDIDVAEVTDTADFVKDLDVDSLMALEVMVVLERRYSVKLDEKRLAEITGPSQMSMGSGVRVGVSRGVL